MECDVPTRVKLRSYDDLNVRARKETRGRHPSNADDSDNGNFLLLVEGAQNWSWVLSGGALDPRPHPVGGMYSADVKASNRLPEHKHRRLATGKIPMAGEPCIKNARSSKNVRRVGWPLCEVLLRTHTWFFPEKVLVTQQRKLIFHFSIVSIYFPIFSNEFSYGLEWGRRPIRICWR